MNTMFWRNEEEERTNWIDEHLEVSPASVTIGSHYLVEGWVFFRFS